MKKKNINLFNYFHGSVLYHVVQIASIHRIDENHFLHDEPRNCLFDMCGNKKDIVLKYGEPKLCDECLLKIKSNYIDIEFLKKLNKEFKSFKPSPLERLVRLIRKKPIRSMVVTAISSIALNILASWLYEKTPCFLAYLQQFFD